ncbi:MAG: hypothetical protein AABX79_01285 [Nanoarchaeota archaeon]
MGTLEDDTRKLIALKLLASASGSFGDRANRRFEQVREDLGKRLKKGTALPEDSELLLKLSWDDEAVKGARKISLGIEEFKQKYPEEGKTLQEIINKHRTTRRAYLKFGGVVEEEIYIAIIREVMGKITYDTAREIYGTINSMAKVLGKEEGVQESLLSE